MVEKDAVSKEFRKQVLGYGLTTAEIVYRLPDRHWLLQTYVWQDYDMFPNFPALRDFLAFWEKSLEGPLFAVTVAHSKLIKPAELHAVDGVFRLHWFNWSNYGGALRVATPPPTAVQKCKELQSRRSKPPPI
jgi:uncharacterized protein Usg